MQNLVINRVKYKLDEISKMHISKGKSLRFDRKSSFVKEKLEDTISSTFQEWCDANEVKENDYIYYDFFEPERFEGLSIEVGKYFYPHYIKSVLIRYFEKKDFLVDQYHKFCDLRIYERIGEFNLNWGIFRSFDISIKNRTQEISFNVSSNKTLISNEPFSTQYRNIKGVSPDGKVKRIGQFDSLPVRIIANKEVRDELHVDNSPRPISYKELYAQLNSFFQDHLQQITDDYLVFPSRGLLNVNSQEVFKVNIQTNKMLFRFDSKDINAVTGMRDFGAYKTSPKALENKFIFIYENRDDANKLYQYLKNGLKHFPGLERYVGVPVTLDVDRSNKYSSFQNLKTDFDEFVEAKLHDETYDNYFAIVIGPFQKADYDEEETELYFYIKEKLLSKGISSQFVSYKSIRNSSAFHFYLPNIAIAILAKLGGIPWRLENKNYKELIVGFNHVRLENRFHIGSAVFFSNEGYLSAVNAFPQSSSGRALIEHLRDAIKKYLEENREFPKRLVIHYYKPYSGDEKEKIEELLRTELDIDIPFAIVEINDSKSHSDICFDKEYDMGMPESGVYVKVGWNEYLLFNNTRYEEKPLRSVVEELPIKVKIHYADDREFLHKDLINQIYEFSRLYWKSLKQRSQPVTTIYSKLIADFSAHFDGNLPDNEITNNTPWFL